MAIIRLKRGHAGVTQMRPRHLQTQSDTKPCILSFYGRNNIVATTSLVFKTGLTMSQPLEDE